MRCLQSIRNSKDPYSKQIIYVDSNSTDGSPQRAAVLCDQVITVNPSRPCAAVGRNAGWRASQGEFVLFLDGDTVLDPDFINHAMTQMQQPDVAVVWGHRKEMYPQQSLWTRAMNLDWIYAPGDTLFCGGDAMMRRSVLERTGGFDETLIAGEEPELCQRIRTLSFRILHIDVSMTQHDLAITRFSQYCKRASRAGFAYAEIARRGRHTGNPLWSHDVRSNYLRGGFWTLWLLMLPVVAWWSPLVALCWLGILCLVCVRSAYKARWKAPAAGASAFDVLVYGFHSQLQHIPILYGQFQYTWARLSGRQRGLIEYK